ncbi:hypothetical protein BJY01DRAFT_250905 [Aspergillus pseudoustus]|uniref:Phytanoyl-CoA dioxygenase family protein n=1 Tax=Aspergillus pseudoustus TaxID=1810923 RepID=A0ABR4JEQ9_9EURO
MACPKNRVYYLDQPPLVDDLKHICSRLASKETYPLASDIQKNIPIYDVSKYAGRDTDTSLVESLQDEWSHILSEGPGVIVLKRMYAINGLEQTVDAANKIFGQILDDETRAKQNSDEGNKIDRNLKAHNVFTKLAKRAPQVFVDYYSNPWLDRVSQAWLGPGYRFNASLNIVPPGGPAQPAHRDFHMGFFGPDKCVKFPRLLQVANQTLTLQGAVAHSDMPMPSGPTRFLPFSQLFEAGYMAHRREEFQQYFQANYVSLPLEKGDGLFFNPSILHAAGNNTTTDFYRSAQLIQVNSIFGKPSEWVSSVPIVDKTWTLLREKYHKEGPSTSMMCLVQAIGDGYQFPVSLDNIQGDLFAMKTEQDLIQEGLEAGWDRDKIIRELKSSQKRRLSPFLDEL